MALLHLQVLFSLAGASISKHYGLRNLLDGTQEATHLLLCDLMTKKVAAHAINLF